MQASFVGGCAMTEQCGRCNEPADHHLETMTMSECLCAHCARVAMGLILAPNEPSVTFPDNFQSGA